MASFFRSLLNRIFPRPGSSSSTTLRSEADKRTTIATYGLPSGPAHRAASPSELGTTSATTPPASSGRTGLTTHRWISSPPPPASRVRRPAPSCPPTEASPSTGISPTTSSKASPSPDFTTSLLALTRVCETYVQTHKRPYCLSCSTEGHRLLAEIAKRCEPSSHSYHDMITMGWPPKSEAWRGSGEELTLVRALFDAARLKRP